MFRGVILSFSVMLSAFTIFHYLMLNNVIKAYSDSDGAIVGINVFYDDSAYMLKPQEMVQDHLFGRHVWSDQI